MFKDICVSVQPLQHDGILRISPNTTSQSLVFGQICLQGSCEADIWLPKTKQHLDKANVFESTELTHLSQIQRPIWDCWQKAAKDSVDKDNNCSRSFFVTELKRSSPSSHWASRGWRSRACGASADLSVMVRLQLRLKDTGVGSTL